MSSVLFPGVEPGGSDSLRPVETGLVEELLSYYWTIGSAERSWNFFCAGVDFYHEINEA